MSVLQAINHMFPRSKLYHKVETAVAQHQRASQLLDRKIEQANAYAEQLERKKRESN